MNNDLKKSLCGISGCCEIIKHCLPGDFWLGLFICTCGIISLDTTLSRIGLIIFTPLLLAGSAWLSYHTFGKKL